MRSSRLVRARHHGISQVTMSPRKAQAVLVWSPSEGPQPRHAVAWPGGMCIIWVINRIQQLMLRNDKVHKMVHLNHHWDMLSSSWSLWAWSDCDLMHSCLNSMIRLAGAIAERRVAHEGSASYHNSGVDASRHRMSSATWHKAQCLNQFWFNGMLNDMVNDDKNKPGYKQPSTRNLFTTPKSPWTVCIDACEQHPGMLIHHSLVPSWTSSPAKPNAQDPQCYTLSVWWSMRPIA